MSETAQERNMAKALRDGPGLSYGYSAWVEARGDGMVLLGGLGGLGCGSMWVKEEPHHSGYEGYEAAPHAPEMRDGFGDTAAEMP